VAFWLFKEEPEVYSYADLESDGRTTWTGVSNALARQNLRKVQVGDRVFFYHTGKEKAIVGEIRVVAGPEPDPSSEDARAVVVEVEPVRKLSRPVSLARIKQEAELADWELVRLPRLSVVPVNARQWERIEALGQPDI